MELDPTAIMARLAEACARVHSALTPDDVLDVVAEEAGLLAGAQHAWAASVAGAKIVSLRGKGGENASSGSSGISASLDSLLSSLIAAQTAQTAQPAQPAPRPLARVDGVVGVALLGSSGAPEGILAVRARATDDGAATTTLFDLALSQLATVAGLALEAARLRQRVEGLTRTRELLLGSVSHDLRNPLNTFAMSAGLLRDDLERNEVDAVRGLALLTRMDRASARMQAIIEDLVEASRVDARKIAFAIREESAAQIVRDAVKAAAPPPSQKAAAVTSDVLDDDARVMADRARTLQILAKIIAFETKSTGDTGSVQIGVARKGDAVEFTARGLGPGGAALPAADEHRGGLSLLLARGLVEAQRGTFRIESGEGLAVVFTLPAAKP